jgi:cyclophilin family peptidyl-prolyl cis-trans isomerase
MFSAGTVKAPTVRGALFRHVTGLVGTRAWLVLTLVVSLLALDACHKKPKSDKTSPGVRQNSQRLLALASAEGGRDAHQITNDDLMSRDVDVRRRAMKALARIADETARPALERGLSDEDAQVVSWAAFGLGRACEKDADQAVAQLALRGASWSVSDHTPPSANRFDVDPMSAIADALGRCGTLLAEATLRNWLRLEADLAERSAIAIGTIAAKQHRLEYSTLVALLDAADSKSAAISSALFPFSRLSAVDANVQKRLLSVANKVLLSRSDARTYAIRALQLAGDSAIPLLERILTDKAGYNSEQRSDAARGLSRLGDGGQQSLSRALPRLLPREFSKNTDWLMSAELSPIAELLEHLDSHDAESRPILEALARWPILDTSPAAISRRVTMLRCQSASILAGKLVTSPLLDACDPAKDGRQGALAVIRVLGRGPIRGHRAQLFDKLAHSSDLVVREGALRWLHSHPEIRESAHILADALLSESAGVVATAAGIVAEHPERTQGQVHSARLVASSSRAQDSQTSEYTPHPTPELLLALGKATHRSWASDAIDVRVQLLDATSALGVLSERTFVEEQCRSALSVLRSHAESALHHFGDTKRHCVPAKPLAAPTALAASEEVHLRFHTDVGPLDLWLEPFFAPLATARLLDLAKNGFFNGITVHRVVPGFVVQLGDRAGDGFGGADQDPLRDELAPVGFRTHDVGLALSGPDTGSSQFFVVLGPHPHLDGEYTRVGRAGEGWNPLVAGDTIQSVERVY